MVDDRRLCAGLAVTGHRLRYGAIIDGITADDLDHYARQVRRDTGCDCTAVAEEARRAVADGLPQREVYAAALGEIVERLEEVILAPVAVPG